MNGKTGGNRGPRRAGALAGQEAGHPLGFVNPAIYRITRGPLDRKAFRLPGSVAAVPLQVGLHICIGLSIHIGFPI
jgi:hypothetical protein